MSPGQRPFTIRETPPSRWPRAPDPAEDERRSLPVYALHENPEWFPPFAQAFADAGVEVVEWVLTDGVLDLDAARPLDGRLLTYDVNTNTNDNPAVEAVAPRSAPAGLVQYLARVAEQEASRAAA